MNELNAFAALLAEYVAALARLVSLGIRPAQTSRLIQYRDRLSAATIDPNAALPENVVAQLAFDLREIDEIIEIVDNLPVPVDKACMRLLRSLAKGGDNPDVESSTRAREDQYELYLGAVLRRSGVAARHGAPDLSAEACGQRHHIEAKRPSRLERLDDRVRSAVHQLRALRQEGIIALCVDQIVRPSGNLLVARTFDDLAPGVARLVANFVASNLAVWRRRLSGEKIAALIITARVPALIAETGHTALGTNIHIELLRSEATSAAAMFAARMAQAYRRAQAQG